MMNLRETIISSFFLHLILLLLLTAVANYKKGFSNGIPNIVSVDLFSEYNKYLPVAGIDSADAPSLASSPTSDEEVSLSDQAADSPAEESKKIAGPEKKADPKKIENAESSPASGGSTSLEAYHQFILSHKRVFMQKAGGRVNDLIGKALKENKRDFFGGTAIVILKFGPDGKLSGVLVDSAYPELKAFLEEIGWVAVPAPSEYLPGYSGVQIEFKVLEGYLSYKIGTL